MNTVTQKDIFGLVKSMVGSNDVKAINMTLVDFTGDWPPAILLSQLLFWSDKTRIQDGWIAKTYEDWFMEIRLSEYQVRKATKLMEKEMQIVETMVKKFNGNPTVHYRLKSKEFSESFLKFLKERNASFSTIESKETSESMETEETSGTITEPNKTENTLIEASATFEIFWNAYGKKIDREKCFAKWGKLKPAERQKALETVEAYVRVNHEYQYRKNPLTYLNGKCFNDEIAGAAQAPVKNQLTMDAYKSLWQ